MDRENHPSLSLDALHESLFTSMSRGAVYQDATSKIIAANPIALQILGLTEDQIYGRSSLDPRWHAVHEDGSPFPGKDHPAMVVLRTGKPVLDTVMGVFNPQTETTNWIKIDAFPQFLAGPKKPSHAIVTFEDITSVVKLRETTLATENRYRSLLQAMQEPSYVAELIRDDEGKPVDLRFLDVNLSFITQAKRSREQLVGRTYIDVFDTNPALERWLVHFDRVEKTGKPDHFIDQGGVFNRTYEVSAFRPEVGRFAVTINDITDRLLAEKKVGQLQRLFATLSEINETIVRSRDEFTLYQTLCGVAIETGGFDLVWIGNYDESSRLVTPLGSAANKDLPDSIRESVVKPGPIGEGLMLRACQEKTAVYCVHGASSQNHDQWQRAALAAGIVSLAVTPILKDGNCFGMIGFYSFESDFFQSDQELKLLNDIGENISFALQTLRVEKEKQQAVEKVIANERVLKLFVEYSPAAIAMFDLNMKYLAVSRRFRADYRLGDREILGLSHYEVFPEISERWREIHRRCLAGAVERCEEDPFPREDGTLDWVRWEIHPWKDEAGAIAGIILFSEVITDQKQVKNQLKLALDQYRLISENSSDWVYWINPDGSYHYNSPSCEKMTGYTVDDFNHQPNLLLKIVHPEDVGLLSDHYDLDRQATCSSLEFRIITRDGSELWIEHYCSPLYSSDGQFIGRLGTNRNIDKRKRAEERIQNQLQRLSALRSIDTAIASSMELDVTLNVLLEQVTSQLNVDAALVLLLNPSLNELQFAAGRGFRSPSISDLHIKMGAPYAGEAALHRKMISMLDLARVPDNVLRAPVMTEDNFASFIAVPLEVKGRVNGVLEVFHRTRLKPDAEWWEFLEILAGQSAIAIDGVQMFERLQRSNNELVLAYDATIEGWSRAMDLRDKETEGHTQRVMDITMELARAAGIPPEQLAHIRRGALLHDIGKLGVPDEILLKPGKLTDEEWEIMRKHPVFAYEMLAPIDYLRAAIDIPYCHHEKWDGSGYPRGLKGEQIPLEARLFAVVDVWDALRSDRPYRASWPEDKVIAHILAESGTHFDPMAVDLFLKVMKKV